MCEWSDKKLVKKDQSQCTGTWWNSAGLKLRTWDSTYIIIYILLYKRVRVLLKSTTNFVEKNNPRVGGVLQNNYFGMC